MMRLALPVALAAMLTPVPSMARAQDPEEVASLQKQNELLKKEVELLKKENELLKKENELLKGDAAANPGRARGPRAKAPALSDLLPEGTVLQGTYRATEGGGHGEITITITERDGNKFKATFVNKQMRDFKELATGDGALEGVINGARISWTSVGGANKSNATLVLKGDGLEGTYRTLAGIYGTIGLRITK